MSGTVVAVHVSPQHTFSKTTTSEIELVEGIGVAGDAHSGVTVKHRSRVAANPSQPNLRQVHLIHSELLSAVAAAGFEVAPGALGENITTSGVDLLGLPVGSRLEIADAIITVTGLRNPCSQINGLQQGLLKQMFHRDADGQTAPIAGVMGIVSRGGIVRAGDSITVTLPPQPHFALARV